MDSKEHRTFRERLKPSGTPWKVPSTILLSFFAAVCLALGHHLFYQSLDGTLLRKATFGQQFNVGIGTAFAFLVRALLVLSIGTTYWQIFWRTVRSHTLAVGKIDTLFGLLHNVFHFFEVSALYKHPLLVAIALLAWTVPIAIIVPPATLSVVSQPVPRHELKQMDVPLFEHISSLAQISKSTGDYSSGSVNGGSDAIGCDYNGNFLLYNSPSVALSRMTMATAFQGVLPNVAQSRANTSYTVTFTAPASSCISAPQSVLSQLGVGGYSTAEGRPNRWYEYEFLSWAPSRSQLVPDNIKGKAATDYFTREQIKYVDISGKVTNTSKTHGFSSYLGQYQDLPPSLFVAYALKASDQINEIWEALDCSFHEANYTVHFDFPNGDQKVTLVSVDPLDEPLKLSVPIWNSCKNGNDKGTILTARQVGYQALIESLGRALVGTMAFEDGLHQTSKLVVDQTSVLKTNLAYAKELRWMYALGQNIDEAPGFETDYTKILNANTSSVPQTNMTVAETVEQLFHNMSLSMFSDKSMLSKSPVRTNVTVTSAENVYSYAWTQLVLAYGIAVAVTLITVVVGCVILLANGAAYSSDFSTFLRLVRGQHIDDVVAAHDDRNGADPLPKSLAKARIQIDGIDGRSSAIAKRSPQSHHSSSAAEQAEWSGMLTYSSSYGAHA